MLRATISVENLQALQDVLNCLVLSEVVYKVVDLGEEAAAASVTQLRQDFPPGLVSVQHLQWSLPHVGHRYLVAEGGDALYVAFMGTKARRDLLTNANVVLEPLWPDEQPSAEGPVPSAHRGFLQRARGVPLASLAEHARRQGKRLVFCGHSLGGAVATLCTLDLLHGLPRHASLPVSCVAFAGPAVGNAALAKLVRRRGWERHLSNFMLPEDHEAAPSGMLAISPLHAAAADSGGRMFGANRTARDGEGSPRVGLLSGSTPRRQHSGSPTRRHAMGLRFRTNNVVVRGEGLDTCTSAKVRALGETWLPVELVSQPAPGAAAVGGHLRSPWRALREAAGGLVREGEHMV
ncbi:hypothetical protein WJX72_008693 [[Myrmecia] bisecta]|uniref:Fungal lipase-type domain-containing protein n=1 Tax=[Myrmecia] bisecta TaxID=41462 RepID=A0AAW1QGC1_9CHLO